MKTITTTAIVALMTATIGLAAVAPTYAQSAAPSAQQHNFRADHHGQRQGGRMDARMGGGDVLNFARGAEGVEIALVRLSHRVTLTTEQQPLFDTLKTAALAAATDFTTATASLRPTAPADGETATRPGPAERLDARIAIAAAHLAALEAVQPAATAFFDSLSAEQLAQLTPQRPDRGGKLGQFNKRGPAAPAVETAPAPQG
ncbi:Spy/CpxP family protein refolding chaperone [Devosia sp. A369]